MGSTATYLYCIVHAAAAPKTARAPQGLPAATRPRVVAVARSLWMVVADVPLELYGPEALETSLRDMPWVAEVAVAHEAVVEHFARQPNATVIPTSLFTMFSTIDRAVAETRSRRREMTPVIKRIAGCEEWGVRMIRTARANAKPTASPARSLGGAASGAAFLAAKKQARDDAREAVRVATSAANDAFEALAAIARDARRRNDAPEPAVTPPLLDAAFLVPADRRARFRSVAKRLAAGGVKAGAQMTLTGPWPAYNFIQTERRR